MTDTHTPSVPRAGPASPHSSSPPTEASIATPLELVAADLASELSTAAVPWVVLRGHESFPRVASGTDLVLCVSPGAMRRFDAILRAVCRRRRARILERFRAGSMREYLVHGTDSRGEHHFLDLVVHTHAAYRGVPFFPARKIVVGSCDWRGLPTPEEHVSALVDFLGPFLSSAVVDERYAARLGQVAVDDGDLLAPILVGLVGRKLAARMFADLREGDLDGLRRKARPFRKALLMRRFTRAPLRSTWGALRHGWALHVRPLFRPRGLFVAFLGTDGSGKSSLIEALRERLAPVYRGATSGTWHLRPGLMPRLGRVAHLGRSTYGLKDVSRPRRPVSGPLFSNLRVAWYTIDYVLGYVVRVLPRRRRHALILFDRYFHDFYVDPLRSRVRPGTLATRLLEPFVPRPDAIIVVTASLDGVRARKAELSRQETVRQLDAYEDLALRGGRFHLVDNEGSLEDTLRQVIDALFRRGPA